MNREQRVISAVLDSRQAWDVISGMMEESDFSDLGWIILQQVQEYYNNDAQAPEVSREFLVDSLKMRHPRLVERFTAAIEELAPVSVPNIMQEFRALKMDSCASMLAEAILSNDRQAIDIYYDKYTKYKEVATEDDTEAVFVDADLGDILTVHQPENLIPVVPEALNDRLDGGLIPGSQVAVYAPTEVGKSMFAINMAAGMLEAGRRVLYCGNEDPAKAMLLRFYARLSGMDKHEIMAAPNKARERAVANGFCNLVFYEMSPGTISDVSRQIDRYKPDIVFVDQMANMQTSSNYSKTEKNEYLSVKFRELAKKHDVVTVILHQASDDAYGNLIVHKNDMYYSNVGVQGQMDVMIGLGMDSAYEQQNKRMVCLTKNKLSGNHDCFPVNVTPSISAISGG